MKHRIPLVFVLFALLVAQRAVAQQISIDRGVRAADLWCFPLLGEPQTYVYVPAGARLATDDDGKPNFSFVRYAVNTASDASGGETITTAGGGGVVHFLVQLDTSPEVFSAAAASLKELLGDDEIKLRGPIVFSEGRYVLVSSILDPSDGSSHRHMLASGRAPVLEGNRLAFSFELEPERASLLMESFKMSTPDVSVVFDMSFQGLSDAYQAEMTIDWSEVRNSQVFDAGASVYFVSADVEVAIDRLRRENAIQLRTSGSDASMEALLSTVYSRLLDLLFRPVEPEKVPADQRGGLMDAVSALIDPDGGALSGGNTTGFGVSVGYQVKDLRSSGFSVLDFNHRATVDRHAFITFNIGDLHSKYGQDPAFFRAVNLDDATFQQREIHVGVDGALLADFDSSINSVTIALKKEHENGEYTVREMVVDRSALEKSAGDLRLVYGWKGDEDRLKWLEYETRTRWSFKGGGAYQTDWQRSDAAMVELFAPFERRTVQLSGDNDRLQELGVRAVVVRIEYPFFDDIRRHQLVVRGGDPIDQQSVEITLPRNQFDYQCTIIWRLEGNRTLTTSSADSSGLVFVDELPDGGAADSADPPD